MVRRALKKLRNPAAEGVVGLRRAVAAPLVVQPCDALGGKAVRRTHDRRTCNVQLLGDLGAGLAQAEAGQKAALLNYQRAIQSAFGDVEDALSSREQLGEQLAAQQRLVKALQDYRELAILQFDGGYTPYFTVLQAEQQLFPEELNLAATRAQLFASLVNIYKALGGGWVDLADKMTAVDAAKSTDGSVATAEPMR